MFLKVIIKLKSKNSNFLVGRRVFKDLDINDRDREVE